MMDQTEIHIKRSIDETRNAMGEKIDMIVNRIHNTIIGPKVAVDNLIENLNEYRKAIEEVTSGAHNGDNAMHQAVSETVERLKAIINIIEQMKQDPWALLASAVLTGYVIGNLSRGDSRALRYARPQLQESREPQSRTSAAPH